MMFVNQINQAMGLLRELVELTREIRDALKERGANVGADR